MNNSDPGSQSELPFDEAVRGLIAGDFSRLKPLFEPRPDGTARLILKWYEDGLFAGEPKALEEAFTCACFNGCVDVVEYLLARGANPLGGANTGLNAFHWAANRGQLDVVKVLIRNKAPLEIRNAYGGTVLGCTVWSALNEPKPHHVEIIRVLLAAGAQISEAEYPTGDKRVDDVLKAHGAV
jgi:hypothetical protein